MSFVSFTYSVDLNLFRKQEILKSKTFSVENARGKYYLSLSSGLYLSCFPFIAIQLLLGNSVNEPILIDYFIRSFQNSNPSLSFKQHKRFYRNDGKGHKHLLMIGKELKSKILTGTAPLLNIDCGIKEFTSKRFVIMNEPGSLLDDLLKSVVSGEKNITLLCAERKTIKAHKEILALRSRVFKVALAYKNIDSDLTLDISECSVQVVQALVYFMYNDALCVADFELLVELLIAAEKYELTKLQRLCENYISNHFVSIRNCCFLLAIAYKINASSLKRDILNFISCYAQEIFEDETYWKTDIGDEPAILCDILKTVTVSKDQTKHVFKKTKIVKTGS